jgi:hypothetical protein
MTETLTVILNKIFKGLKKEGGVNYFYRVWEQRVDLFILGIATLYFHVACV